MKLSIVTINLNNLEGLQRTVVSVLNQTWQGFEHIVIDGGSTDGSLAYLKENSEQFSYWSSEPDSGVYAAMNKGIKKAKGDYLLFLNSGDCFVGDDVLEEVEQKLDEVGLIVDRKVKMDFEFVFRYSLPHPETFIKRGLFDTVGLYNETAQITSDWQFFMLALFVHDVSYQFMDQVIAVVEDGGISQSAGSLVIIREEKKAFMLENRELMKEEFLAYFFELEQTLGDVKRSRLMKILVGLGFFKYLKILYND